MHLTPRYVQAATTARYPIMAGLRTRGAELHENIQYRCADLLELGRHLRWANEALGGQIGTELWP